MSQSSDIAYTIGQPVSQDKLAVIGFLNKNLVLVNESYSDEQIISAMIDAFADNPTLYESYLNWLANRYTYFRNADGADSSGGFGFNMGSLTNLLGSAANLFGTIKGSQAALDAAKAQANAVNNQANSQNNTNATNLEIAKLQLAASMQKPAGSNTALYVVLGVVGVSLIGTMIYLVARKK